jgi:2-polyprenyl-3-methyl-5-hydroxy-6-metoxy-1,4-benzoquinol methylase
LYKYPGLTPSIRPDIWERLQSAASTLDGRLRALDLSGLSISEYNRAYLRNHHIPSLRSTLQKYAYILGRALSTSPKSVAESTVVDYGGGAGVMAMLAKAAGVKAVIYNDIYDVSCRDARIVADAVGFTADHYVQGELGDLRAYLSRVNVVPDVIVSYDVIEHIYDIEPFFDELPSLNPKGLSIFMASGANERNAAIKRSISARQHIVENVGRENHAAHKQRDTTTAYRAVRAGIVRSAVPRLSEDDVAVLAERTRGYIEKDIIAAAKRFAADGRLPQPTSHPTNTCDPLTGNWEEHFMDPESLAKIVRRRGLQARVVPGYWGTPRSSSKRFIAPVLNTAITAAGMPAGLRLAPYYAVWAWTA